MPTPLGIALNTVAAQLASLIETTFPDECSISRKAESANVTAFGSAPPTYSTVASSIGCSWAPAGKDAKEYIRAAQLTGVTVYAVTLPAATDVKPKDRVVVVTRGAEPARTFEVRGVIRNAGLPLMVLCTLEEQ